MSTPKIPKGWKRLPRAWDLLPWYPTIEIGGPTFWFENIARKGGKGAK